MIHSVTVKLLELFYCAI